jgi:hypothetical protein
MGIAGQVERFTACLTALLHVLDAEMDMKMGQACGVWKTW